MKKYYGYFDYKGTEYVIRFRIKGSLQWDEKARCFVDRRLYVRSYEDLIAYAAFDTSPCNIKDFWACGLTHKGFIEQRSRGVKRWTQETVIIKWPD